MKKLLLFFLFTFISCTSDSSPTPSVVNGSLTYNNRTYDFNNVYVERQNDFYIIYIAKGEMTFTNDGIETHATFSDDFANLLNISIYNSSNNPISENLMAGTYNYSTENTGAYYLHHTSFSKKENGQSSMVFNENDIINNQGRVIINKTADDKYTFDFNFVTSVGVINGTYSGFIHKVNY